MPTSDAIHFVADLVDATQTANTFTAALTDARQFSYATPLATTWKASLVVTDLPPPDVGADTTKPTIPGNLRSTAHSSASVSLAWDASTDNVGILDYRVRRGGVVIATVYPPATSYIDTGLNPSTPYTYTVRARDAAFNTTADSNSVTVTTDAAADTTPPTAPTALHEASHDTADATIAWTGSTDNVGVTGYLVLRDGVQIGTTNSATLTFSDSGLAPGTSYTYTVRARDAAGNVSADSNPLAVTTDVASQNFSPGPPSTWVNLASAGGHRPDLVTYNATTKFGPSKAYYDNAAARSVVRGVPSSSQKYYPPQLGHTVTAVFPSPTNLRVTAPGHDYTVGMQVRLNDLTPKNSSPWLNSGGGGIKPNGLYTVSAVSGNDVTFSTGFPAVSGVYNDGQPGYSIKESAGIADSVYTVEVNPDNIGSAINGTVLFSKPIPGDPCSVTNPWTWIGGYCHAFLIDGATACDPAFVIRIPSNLDVINASAEYATNGANSDPGLLNPFSTLQFSNCTIQWEGGSAQATSGGTMAYSQPLNGLYYNQGESISYQGVTGLLDGLILYGFCYDGNKIGGGSKNLRWKRLFSYRNRRAVAAGGGHTDDLQIFDLDNSGLPVDEPTVEWSLLASGGNSMLFPNEAAGSGTGTIRNVWARYCLAHTGNKFLDLAKSQGCGARICWVNADPAVTVKPTPVDFGNGGSNHPYPTGNLVIPDPTNPNAILLVAANGALTPMARPTTPAGSTFTYVN